MLNNGNVPLMDLSLGDSTRTVTTDIPNRHSPTIVPNWGVHTLYRTSIGTNVMVLSPTSKISPMTMMTNGVKRPINTRCVFRVLTIPFNLRWGLTSFLLFFVRTKSNRIFRQHNHGFRVRSTPLVQRFFLNFLTNLQIGNNFHPMTSFHFLTRE